MMKSFTRTRQRPPTHEEWEGLVRAPGAGPGAGGSVLSRGAGTGGVNQGVLGADRVRVMRSWIAATGLLMIGWSLRTGN